MKETIKKITTLVVIVLFCYSAVANIHHIISINKEYRYDFGKEVEIAGIKKSYVLLNSYIDNLKKLQDSALGDEVVEAYTKSLENVSANMANFAIMQYKGEVALKQKDLYQMIYDYDKLNTVDILNIYKRLNEKYSSAISNEKQFTEHIYYMLLSSNYLYENLLNNYTYTSPFTKDTYSVIIILSLYQEKLNTINYVNQLVIATGTVSEQSLDNALESGENNE